jgi:hypothetical protein
MLMEAVGMSTILVPSQKIVTELTEYIQIERKKVKKLGCGFTPKHVFKS